mmetsp:Transcript_15055/g.20152  ORF Transcript_15055/g.20152 Transcript_15055/m.20152 type:complete len:240 (+) Transcript_15055:161-880(+)
MECHYVSASFTSLVNTSPYGTESLSILSSIAAMFDLSVCIFDANECSRCLKTSSSCLQRSSVSAWCCSVRVRRFTQRTACSCRDCRVSRRKTRADNSPPPCAPSPKSSITFVRRCKSTTFITASSPTTSPRNSPRFSFATKPSSFRSDFKAPAQPSTLDGSRRATLCSRAATFSTSDVTLVSLMSSVRIFSQAVSNSSVACVCPKTFSRQAIRRSNAPTRSASCTMPTSDWLRTLRPLQ